MTLYHIIFKIGSGAFGRVYHLQSSKNQYALKVVSRNIYDDLNRGDSLLLGLCHAHLVRCWEAFQCDSSHYFILELCSCGSLAGFLNNRTKLLSQERVVAWFGQIADVLRYLHDMNVIHRDLKPDNIFLDENENIKVGDLGIARKLESTDYQAKSILGTWCYTSPEIHDGHVYNFKVDIWSFGCCMHEMMTLGKTFKGSCIWELLQKIDEGRIPKISDVYEEELRNLVLSLLSKNPTERPDALHILFILSKFRGKQVKPTPVMSENVETFDQEEICKALKEFESSKSNSGKIIPLCVNSDETDSHTLRASRNSKVFGDDSSESDTLKASKNSLHSGTDSSPLPKPRKKKKSLFKALKNDTITLKERKRDKSEVDNFMDRLQQESITWLEGRQNKSHCKTNSSDNALESYSVTLSTQSQSASFFTPKFPRESKSHEFGRKLNSSMENPGLLTLDVGISMMKLCQGHSRNLSEMMLRRVMGSRACVDGTFASE